MRARGLAASTAAGITRYAHLVAWDENSFSSLKRNADKIDVLIAEWLQLDGASGDIRHDYAESEKRARQWLSQQPGSLKVYPHVSNYDSRTRTWDAKAVVSLLASAEARQRFIGGVVAYLAEGKFEGVVLDFESLPAQARWDFNTLTRELAERLRQLNCKLLVQVPVDDVAYDYRELATASDGLILMTYDEHGEQGAPGPLAGQGWFESRVDRIARLIPPEKLIVSVGSYGYDWAGHGKAGEISVQEAWELLAEARAQMSFDQRSLNPTFKYRHEGSDADHTVWFLDGVTAFNQIAAAMAAKPAGLALWRLGTEDPSVWASFGRDKSPSADSMAKLQELGVGYDVLYKGRGEVLSVDGAHKVGSRKLTYDAMASLIINQMITEFPKSTVVTRRGYRDDKLVALTFDDGPDPVYTPQILDILAEKGAKATFFIVGSAGVVNGDLLRRIYRDGHDIGNHTFTHVNSSEVPGEYLKFELTATQRLLEATVGARTHLFRPPFARDLEPQTIDAAEALKISSGLGYVTIGMGVDPKDWARPFARQIADRTIEGIRRRDGNVVLLHDSGGSRTPTITALPIIIDTLKADGYRFVTIHELLGMSREDLMPPVKVDGAVVAKLNSAGFSLVSSTSAFAQFLFYAGIFLGAIRLVWIGSFSIVQTIQCRKRAHLNWMPQSFTILIPAYNEAQVITKSISSLLASDVDNFKIIVVDDGSSDGTADVVEKLYGDNPRIQVIRKPNGGKSTALNTGIAATDDDIIVTLDADTVFRPDALRKLLRHFCDPSVGAVAGYVSIGNKINLVTRFQAIEYITNQNLDRRALEVVNGITTVPGAIGAWRRQAILAVGGYLSDTLAEDSDATVRLAVAGWKVVCEPEAVALTEAPETVRTFMRQRHRWMFGMLQVAYKNRMVLVRRKPSGIGLFGLTNLVVFQYFFTLVAPLIDLMLIWSLASAYNSYRLDPSGGVPASLIIVGEYWIIFQIIELGVAVLAMTIDRREQGWRLLPLLLLQRFFYRQLLYITSCRVTLAALKGTIQGWGKLARTGHVAPAA